MDLFDFAAEPELCTRWSSVDDRVMGGESSSAMHPAEEYVVYEGVVSLAHNGGFASTRSPAVEFDLSDYDGLDLRVCGDGRTYGAIVRCRRSMGVRYQVEFATEADAWIDVRLPFSAFDPKVFGMVLPLAPPLNLRHITSLGLIISDGKAGPFRLAVARIAAYRRETH